MRGDEGFINFNVAEPATENKKLKFTGVFYLVKKRESSENTWEIKYKKSISGDKKTDKDQLDTYFPKPYSTLPNAAQTY